MGRIIGGFFALLVGLGIFWGTWALSQSTLKLKAEAVKTEGTVIDFETKRSTRIGSSETYAPIVEYTTAEGQTLTFTTSISSSSPSYERGEKVKVLLRLNLQVQHPEPDRVLRWTNSIGI